MGSGEIPEKTLMDVTLEALGKNIARLTKNEGSGLTDIPGLSVFRREKITTQTVGIYEPGICVMAQGAKRILVGEDSLVYDSRHFLITSVDLPTFVQVIQASPETPCLGLVLKLDWSEISRWMVDGVLPPPLSQAPKRGMAIGKVTLPLVTAFYRLIDLLVEPHNIPALLPLIRREIFYLLLVSDQGMRLRQMAAAESRGRQIARAIEWLKIHFAHPLRMEELASVANMSPSTFYHHFRAMTAMSPLQYQKRLRLHEARRLMLSERLDATSAAIRVGYESPSQFSREYGRLFGNSPLRDIKNLRQASALELM